MYGSTGPAGGPLLLYALLIAAPVAGIVVQFARGDALPLFGLSEIPSPWAADQAFARSVKEVHEVLATALATSRSCMRPQRLCTTGYFAIAHSCDAARL